MNGLTIPDHGRIFAPVLRLGETMGGPEVHPYGVIRAWRTEVDPYDMTMTPISLCLIGEAPDGTKTRQIQVPEGVIFQGIRERMAAVRVGALLILGRTA